MIFDRGRIAPYVTNVRKILYSTSIFQIVYTIVNTIFYIPDTANTYSKLQRLKHSSSNTNKKQYGLHIYNMRSFTSLQTFLSIGRQYCVKRHTDNTLHAIKQNKTYNNEIWMTNAIYKAETLNYFTQNTLRYRTCKYIP